MEFYLLSYRISPLPPVFCCPSNLVGDINHVVFLRAGGHFNNFLHMFNLAIRLSRIITFFKHKWVVYVILPKRSISNLQLHLRWGLESLPLLHHHLLLLLHLLLLMHLLLQHLQHLFTLQNLLCLLSLLILHPSNSHVDIRIALWNWNKISITPCPSQSSIVLSHYIIFIMHTYRVDHLNTGQYQNKQSGLKRSIFLFVEF